MQYTSGVRELRADIDAAGYFPEFVADTLLRSLADEPVLAHLVHPETTLDNQRFMRHLTVLVLTPTRLLINHTDESDGRRGDFALTTGAASTTESIRLDQITAVALTRVCADPARFKAGQPLVETWLQLGWGIVHRVDLAPAACEDPTCDADHGYTGDMTSDDLVVRISEAADGRDRVAALEAFGVALQLATRGER